MENSYAMLISFSNVPSTYCGEDCRHPCLLCRPQQDQVHPRAGGTIPGDDTDSRNGSVCFCFNTDIITSVEYFVSETSQLVWVRHCWLRMSWALALISLCQVSSSDRTAV